MSKIAIFLLSNFSKSQEKFIDLLDKKGYEVHVIENIGEIYPEYPCEYLLNYVQKSEQIAEEAILVSDVKDIIMFAYRMFNLTFTEFLWLPANEDKIVFEGLYREIASFNAIRDDFVKGKIQVYITEKLSKESLDFLLRDGNYRYFDLVNTVENFAPQLRALDLDYPYLKEYIWNNQQYSIGNGYRRKVYLTEKNDHFDLIKMDHDLLCFLLKNTILLECVLNENLVPELSGLLLDELTIYENSALERADVHEIINFLNNFFREQAFFVVTYLYSSLLNRYNKTEDFQKFTDFLMNSSVSFDRMRFLYSQLIYFVFMLEESYQKEILEKIHLLYQHFFRLAGDTFHRELDVLERSSSNKKNDNIVIFCAQFLEENHAPTRRVMDYTLSYINNLGKNIMIINTAEMSRELEMPYMNGVAVNYMPEYESDQVHKIPIGDQQVLFYQIRSEYRDPSEIEYVFREVMNFEPEYILTVGDSNILADLCSKAYPVFNLPCGTGLTITEGNYYILLRETQEKDRILLENIGKSPERIIESIYTFRKPMMESQRKKEDFGISEDRFCLCIVGNRLNEEIDSQVMAFIERLLEYEDVMVVVIGDFFEYKAVLSRYPSVSNSMCYIGYQKDIMGTYGAFDICFNPKRNGGGSSVAQAMLAGLPVVSLKVGDGAYALGMDLCFDSEEEMITEICKLKNDKNYYVEKSALMKQRAESLFDTNEMIKKLDNDIRTKMGGCIK